MKITDIPKKVSIPFANSAGVGYVTDPPDVSQIGLTGQDGRASWPDGFPPDNFIAVSAGGVPPYGADMNGVLKRISAWVRWLNAGGGIQRWDAALSAAIGGYPKNAVVFSNAEGGIWRSTVDDNIIDPNTYVSGSTFPAGWYPLVPVTKFNNRTGEISLSQADVINALTYTPVQQGTGIRQVGNSVKIGWTAAGNVAITIDSYDWGDIASQAWTIASYQGFVTSWVPNYVQSLFSYTGAGNGIYWRANGVYWQMIGTVLTDQYTAIPWPASFPNACAAVSIIEGNASGWGDNGFNGGPSIMPIFGINSTDRFGIVVRAARVVNGSTTLFPVTPGGVNSVSIIAQGY